MIPPLLVGVGLLGIVLGVLILRTFGSGYRIGRLLAATPSVPISEAVRLASDVRPRYVRIGGRIDAEDEFEDEHHRPLVLRRVRLEARSGRRWHRIGDHRRTVAFVVGEDLDTIGIDAVALDEGLVVIPRESVGVAADAPDAFPADVAPETTVRIRVDQVSSIEHATVCGVPRLDATGAPSMTAGLGRPLVLTTLDRDEAMRVLAHGSRVRPIAAAAALVAGGILVALGLAIGIVSAVVPATVAAAAATTSSSTRALEASAPPAATGLPAASAVPTATAAPATTPDPESSDAAPSGAPASGDTRSAGQGPGFVGAPLLAIGGVALVAAVTIALTLVYVRLTDGASPGGPAPGGPAPGGPAPGA